ncbi:MAG: transglycosylase domain-containing protein [Spirochaetales bacterium]
MLKRFASRSRLGWTLIVAVASLVLLISALLLTINWLIVPRLLTRVADGLSERCECEVAYEQASYVPFRGVVVRGIAVSAGVGERADSRIQVEQVRFPLSRSLLSAVRRRRELSALALSLASTTITALEESYDALRELERYLPRVIEANGVSVRDPRLPGRVTFAKVSIAKDSRATIEVDARGSVAFDRGDAAHPEIGPNGAAFSLYLELAAASRQAEATVALTAFPLAELGRASIEAGVADLELRVQTIDPRSLRFDGFVAAREVTAVLPSISSEPLTDQSVRYEFGGAAEFTQPVPIEKRMPPALLVGRFGKGSIRVTRGEMTLNGLQMSLRPALYGLFAAPSSPHPAEPDFVAPRQATQPNALLDTPRMLEVALEFPPTPVEAIQRALPKPMLGPLEAARFSGTVGWKLDLDVPLHELTWMNWESEVDLDRFAVESIPAAVNVFKLNDAFPHEIGDFGAPSVRRIEIPAERPPDIEFLAELAERNVEQMEWLEARRSSGAQPFAPTVIVSPVEARPEIPAAGSLLSPAFYGSRRSLRYVRLGQMSEWVPKAIMTAEDGDFFYHHGVSFLTLRSAIERNLRAGSIEFGASTISMQLIKMLFLDQQRVFSRKFQEVLLVYLMEHLVPVQKARILELYLNVAEFGPGVFGVHHAARYYFDTLPSRLTIGQATWLASVLPSPMRYHYYFEQGAISDGWFARMKSYYAVMLERERITPEQYAELIKAPPTFPRSALRRAGFDEP